MFGLDRREPETELINVRNIFYTVSAFIQFDFLQTDMPELNRFAYV